MRGSLHVSEKETRLSGFRPSSHYVQGNTGDGGTDTTQSGLPSYRDPEWVLDDIGKGPIPVQRSSQTPRRQSCTVSGNPIKRGKSRYSKRDASTKVFTIGPQCLIPLFGIFRSTTR